MLGPQQAHDVLKCVLHASQAEQTEVILTAQDAYLTRFANNTIHQNVAEADVRVIVRAVVGQQVGRAATNDIRPDSLIRVAEDALRHARQSPPDPEMPSLPEPHPLVSAVAFDDATMRYSPAARAQGVAIICARAAEQGMHAAGAFRTSAREVAIANSLGVFAYHPSTTADIQTVVTGAHGTGWAQSSSWKVAKIQPEAVAREAVMKAVRVQHPRPISAGDYTIVVDPYVTDDLLTTLSIVGMSARDVQEEQSWMSSRLGQQALSPLVSIWDDGLDPAGLPMPFDYEGMPRQRVQIVEEGRVIGPVYDRYTALRVGQQTTGHAGPPSVVSDSGPIAGNLFMAGGEASLEELIGSTERGLYITRFWYPRLINPRDCVISATTRDGVIMIENGELSYAVQNLRFTLSYVQALTDVQAVGCELRTLIDDYGGATRVPALKIGHFTVDGLTK